MMHRSRMFSRLAGAAFTAGALSACGSGGNTAPASGDQTGSLSLLLSSAPPDAACLKVSVAGNRTVAKSFTLTPGETPTLFMDRLPVGVVKVDANAYAEQCAGVASSSVPVFVSEAPAIARIDALEVASIRLKLIRNGRGELAVDFEAPAWLSEDDAPVDLAVIGDTPYGAAQLEDFPNLLEDIAADSRISATVHVGDIKSGSSRCDDAYFARIFAAFASMPIPLVYTPGDNEWTDCHRANNGAYHPLERLQALREIFYPVPGLALGGGFKQLASQADTEGFETYVENQLWFEANVAFGTVHVVGSNDSSAPWFGDDPTGTKADDPFARDAERNARNAATLAWLDRLFELAEQRSAAGVAIFMQADMFDAFSVANGISLAAFGNIVQRIATLATAFGKPVLLVEGDSHFFIADQPLLNGNPLHGVTEAVPNLTRIVVQGSTTTSLTEWLRLHVDPSTPEVFTWERNAR